MRFCFLALFVSLPCWPVASVMGDEPPLRLTATGHDSRIDLRWNVDAESTYHVDRSESADGWFERLTDAPLQTGVYSDFLGENDRTCAYRVTRVEKGVSVLEVSNTAVATTRAMTDDELLTSIQEATFRYFWDFAHPASGLALDRSTRANVVTTSGSGFGVMTIIVAVERGFITREQAADRVLEIATFLEEKADRFHGAWPHFLYGDTGKTRPFTKYDDGADLVETAFLIQGLLTARQYFDRDTPIEKEIRERVTRMWEAVEWDWFLREPDGKRLYWHWSPNHGWKMNMAIGGHYNECMIAYLLAIASPTHPIPAECYYEGWIGDPPTRYLNGKEYYGHTLDVGFNYGGPLFFTHYSFLGFDPRGRDRYCNYFENNRTIALINRAYCIDNPKGFKGYGPNIWGLTASDTPGGYQAHSPGSRDNGTITPTAAISSMPYTPTESMAALRAMYHEHGDRLWGPCGFHDAFNPENDWYAQTYLAIDQGTIVPMIENYRTGLCWCLFMATPEIQAMLPKIEWECE